jgi:hypothetical protein
MEENGGKIRKRLYKDIPLAGISLSEFERPGNDYFTNLRRFCISIGVISPGESRVGIVHILDVLLKARKGHPHGLDSYSIVKELYKTDVKIVYANILRDVRKLIEVGLVEKRDSKYRIKENLNLNEILNSFIKPYIVDRILKRVSEYAIKLDDQINK